MDMTADDFTIVLRERLSLLVHEDRSIFADFNPGLVQGKRRGHVSVTFVNLPTSRVRERRGGGAETENNRALYFVSGFNSPPFTSEPVEKVTVEQLVDNVGGHAEKLRKKTASPDKIASYLAQHINGLAAGHEPRLTHE